MNLVMLDTHFMTANEFSELLKAARWTVTGQTFVYVRGNLAYARKQIGHPNWCELDALAKTAYRAATDGVVCLTQKRVAEGQFEYRATKIRGREYRATKIRGRA